MRKERFSGVITIWSSRASHPIAQSKVGSFPFTFLQFAKGPFAPRVERIPNRPGSLADFFLYGNSSSPTGLIPQHYTPSPR